MVWSSRWRWRQPRGGRFVVAELQRVQAARRAPGRAGGDRREAGTQEAREDRIALTPAGCSVELGDLASRRLPESWIALISILDLARACQRRATRSSTSAASGSSGFTRCSTDHGCPHHHGIGHADKPRVASELQSLELPATAREQVTVALQMVNAVDAQLAPMDKELRAYARRQPGCKALVGLYGGRSSDRGHDPRPSSVEARRCLLARGPSATSRRWTVTVHRVRSAPRSRPPLPPGTTGVALGALRGRPVGSPQEQPRPASTTCRRPSGWAATAPALRSRASCSSAATTPFASLASRRFSPPETVVRAQPSLNPMHRGRLPAIVDCRHACVDGLQRLSGRNAYPSGITRSTIMSPTGGRSWTSEIRRASLRSWVDVGRDGRTGRGDLVSRHRRTGKRARFIRLRSNRERASGSDDVITPASPMGKRSSAELQSARSRIVPCERLQPGHWHARST